MKRIVASFLLDYFRWLAQIQLKKVSPTIVGITGSAGKTSTLQACEAVLTDHFSLKVSHKANSESGIPLNILDLHLDYYSMLEWLRLAVQAPLQVLFHWPSYQIYLVEMGIDGPSEPKNMSYLLKILQPQVGIFLNVAPTHAEPFDHLLNGTEENRREKLVELIAAEKGKLITSLPSTGTAIINADEKLILSLQNHTKAHVITFGKYSESTLQITSFKTDLNGTECELKYFDNSYKIIINDHILPISYGYTFAAAVACGISHDLTLEQSCVSLQKNFKVPPGRSSVIEGINGSTILDSSYNASTAPTLDMLNLLRSTPSTRKLALLGDMRELGKVTASEHEKIAHAATKISDAIFLVGPYMKKYALPIIEKTNIPVEWFENAYLAGEYLKSFLKKGDLLLVKASQNTLLLETAVEQLMAHPEQADRLLCRRGKYWDAQRQKLKG
jgi:UDP-N-acetylmuramoyl-tripeptide--D-alanyl-D-alanine ligase